MFVYQSESGLFEKTHMSMSIVYLQRSIIVSFGSGLFLKKARMFIEKCLYFPEEAFLLVRYPLWKCGGLDSGSSPNKVAR